MTTLFLATLATPTLTSELYECSIRDMAELYETRAFLSEEQAIFWAVHRVGEMEAEMAGVGTDTFDPDYEMATLRHEMRSETGEGNKPCLWMVWSSDEDAMPECSYSVKIWQQEV